jgi:hypothetical protein
LHSPPPVACFSDEDDVSGNQNNCNWPLHSESIARCKHHVKETTNTASSASFFDLFLEFDDSGQLSTKIYDKRDDFNFKIINFSNMCSNIPASPAYGVNDRNSANLELLINKTSSICMYVKLKAQK